MLTRARCCFSIESGTFVNIPKIMVAIQAVTHPNINKAYRLYIETSKNKTIEKQIDRINAEFAAKLVLNPHFSFIS
ncbi:MAG: hypothetical protein MJ227_00605 [Bacilli bacterium]|nr:hypothetical protein [Bacilli bacterium]